jgi:hypothetical protein
MYHPLLGNPAEIKDADLENKINELQRKYSIAARTGMNDVLPQIAMVIEAYRTEMTKRHSQSLKKATKNSNKDLDDLIKVN